MEPLKQEQEASALYTVQKADKRISEIDKSGRVADIKNSISKTVVTMMLLTIVSKIVGFIRI